MLVATAVRKEFGGLVAVNDVDFTVPRGKVVSLIGPNGAGKTTFFNMLTGVYKPTGGRITFLGEDVTGQAAARDHRARHRPDVPEHPPLPEHERDRERDGRHARADEGEPLQLDRPHAVREARGEAGARAALELLAFTGLQAQAQARPRGTCPTATSGGSRWRARSRPSRNCSCSTSRPPA